ncbi:MAG: hypothetical protein HQ513_01795 [Rhodospirillales bacterium]|nr:hypothetical protein [Rhodospirillales bacterium]
MAERRESFERRDYFKRSPGWLRWRLPAFLKEANKIHVPLWLLLSVFGLALLSLTINFDTPQPQREAGEVIVFDPSEAITSDIVRSGYAVIETINMEGLNIKVQRLKIPQGMSLPEALADLHKRYPGLEVDANRQIHLTDPS